MATNNYRLMLEGAINTAKTDENIQQYIKMWQARIANQPGSTLKVRLGIDERSGNVIETISGKYINSMGKMETETKKYNLTAGETPQVLKTITSETQRTTGASNTFIGGMERAIRTTTQYALSLGLIYGAVNQLREGLRYIIDLNKEMTNIQLVSGSSDAEIANLAKGYNTLAKEMGATTLEVAKGSVEFIRQGKTAEETAILIRSSMMMSKLGNMEASDATEKLTSIMNGFKIEAEDTVGIVDRLVGLDNSFATSIDEIATSMKYASNVSQQVGIDFNHLAAYVTTISSVTRMSAETIGQALRTMFSRMSDIKSGKLIDEEGESLNMVESSLKRVNINLRDSNGEFRDMQDVLAEIGGRWDSIGEKEQLLIAKQIAGLRQKEQFLVLMNNQELIQKALTTETEATGLATERYGIYMENVEAATNRFTASWERLATSGTTKGLIVDIVNLGAEILDLISNFGGLPTILAISTLALVAFNSQAIITAVSASSFFTAITAGTFSLSAFGVALNAALGPIGWIAIALGAVTLAIGYFSTQSDRARESISELNSEVSKSADKLSTLNKQQSTVYELGKEFERLRNISNKTNEEQEAFIDVQKRLKELLPQVSGYYSEQGDYIISNAENLQTLIALKKEEIEIEEQKLKAGLKEELEAETKEYLRQADILDYLVQSEQARRNMGGAPDKEKTDAIEAQALITKEYLNKIKQSYYSSGKDAQQSFIDGLKDQSLDQDAKDLIQTLMGIDENAIPEFMKEYAYRLKSGQKPVVEIPVDVVPEVTEESKEAFEQILDYTIDMIKQQTKNEIDILKTRLDSLKEWKDGLADTYEFQHSEEKRLRDAEKDRLKDQLDDLKYLIAEKKRAANEEYEQIKRNFDIQKDQLKTQLDGYNDLIDAQIELLRQKKSELDFEREMEDKQQEIADIQARILELSFDDSEEAIRQRLLLEEQAAGMMEEIDNAVADNAIEQQINVLEQEKENAQAEYELQLAAIEAAQNAAEIQHELRIQELEREQEVAERRYELKVRELEQEQEASDYLLEMNKRRLEEEYQIKEKALQSQIDQLQNYLDEEGTIANDARRMLAQDSENTYRKLMEWNKKYGDGLSETIVNGWQLALDALNEYKASLEGISGVEVIPVGGGGSNNPMEIKHSGLDAGPVGGVKPNERIVKALKGELMLNEKDQKNFMEKALPSMMSTPFESLGGSGGMNITIPISVLGNLDKEILPDLTTLVKNVVGELNKSVANRGFLRQTSLTSV